MAARRFQVNPSVLVQAREVAGLPLDDAARRLKIAPEGLQAIESESDGLGLGLLRRMAAVYQLSPATLLMPEPPPPPRRPEDLRTVGGSAPQLSQLTIRAIRRVEERQDLAAEIAEEAPALLPAAKLPRLRLNDDPSDIADRERRRLGWDWRAPLSWRNAGEAFQRWRCALESRHILVFAERMDRNDARGFCLLGEGLPPAVGVNGAESDPARSFTLFHQYAHVLLRSSALCLEEETTGDHLETERFCNRFAAELLMPRPAVELAVDTSSGRATAGDPWPAERLGAVARMLKVTRPAALIRLHQLGLVSSRHGAGVRDELDADSWKARARGDARGFAASAIFTLGFTYPSLVFRALASGIINRHNAAEMLDVPAHQLAAIKSTLQEQTTRYASVSG